MNFDFLARMRSILNNTFNTVKSGLTNVGETISNVVKPLEVSPVPKEKDNTWSRTTPEGAEQVWFGNPGTTNPFVPGQVQGAQAPQTTPTPNPTPTQVPMPSSPIPSPTPPPVYPNEQLDPNTMAYLEQNIFPITRQAKIPDALVASQWAVEGGRTMGNSQNNMFGLGGTDMVQYSTQERGIEDYVLTVLNILKNKGMTDPSNMNAYDMLMGLQSGDRPRYEAHNPNQWDYTQTVMNTPEWRKYNQE